ncbi:hypothetical protein JOY44_28650 (plasmid) [Phormidium sp. CLA17]|uniref:hypothetical protein n=1 Tax=Leptolyngbya sp. Cla-17 TaxID=2803751 RepID=UPI001490BF7F|nr:hypothetical protein [Leptolyngbya sp. Cla-17]MBM0745397.1 hypothetical protein [Leptolyngbya sp. Cla-17]
MFFKNSRYRKLPDEVTVDAKGRRLTSKSSRALPEVTGIFQHTLADGDRLDHLAHKYYNQPRKWWRICDANPEFMSPQALLGKTPFITQQFPLSFPESQGQPPWAVLMKTISDQVGIEDILLTDDENYLIITFNQINIQASTLTEIISRAGFIVGQPQTIGRTGKQIVIPPDIFA